MSLGERFRFLICMAGRPNQFRRIDSQHLSRSGLIAPGTCLPQHVLQRRITRYIRAHQSLFTPWAIQFARGRTFRILRTFSILRGTHQPLHLGLHLLHRVLPPGCPLTGRSERESISRRKFKEVVLLLRAERRENLCVKVIRIRVGGDQLGNLHTRYEILVGLSH